MKSSVNHIISIMKNNTPHIGAFFFYKPQCKQNDTYLLLIYKLLITPKKSLHLKFGLIVIAA